MRATHNRYQTSFLKTGWWFLIHGIIITLISVDVFMEFLKGIIFFVSFGHAQDEKLSDSKKKLAQLSSESFFFYRIRIVSRNQSRLVVNSISGYNSNIISLNIYNAQCRWLSLDVVLCRPHDFQINYIFVCGCVCVVPRIYMYMCEYTI